VPGQRDSAIERAPAPIGPALPSGWTVGLVVSGLPHVLAERFPQRHLPRPDLDRCLYCLDDVRGRRHHRRLGGREHLVGVRSATFPVKPRKSNTYGSFPICWTSSGSGARSRSAKFDGAASTRAWVWFARTLRDQPGATAQANRTFSGTVSFHIASSALAGALGGPRNHVWSEM
jgi:hypothetical protein